MIRSFSSSSLSIYFRRQVGWSSYGRGGAAPLLVKQQNESASTIAGEGGEASTPPATKTHPIYVAATRQHVGKTAVALALVSGLKKRFEKVGYIKPVGEESFRVPCSSNNNNNKHLEGGGGEVHYDKDAAVVKEHFNLDHLEYQHMSPITIPQGYTKDYIDGRIPQRIQRDAVEEAFSRVSAVSDIVLCEGTGHCAVGAVVGASNARVASWLTAKIILVANGGVGNTFDELELNRFVCANHDLDIAGVIINKVVPEKYEQARYYISKALKQNWGDHIPLLGCVPDRPFLGCPAIQDLEKLFGTTLLSGHAHRLRHYNVHDLILVATSLKVFLQNLRTNRSRTMYVCHASRNDILLGFLLELQRPEQQHNESSLIICGADEYPISEQVIDIIKGGCEESTDERIISGPPILFCSHEPRMATEMIHSFTPKLNFEDSHRVNVAVNHYEPYLDFDKILERTGHKQLLIK